MQFILAMITTSSFSSPCPTTCSVKFCVNFLKGLHFFCASYSLTWKSCSITRQIPGMLLRLNTEKFSRKLLKAIINCFQVKPLTELSTNSDTASLNQLLASVNLLSIWPLLKRCKRVWGNDCKNSLSKLSLNLFRFAFVVAYIKPIVSFIFKGIYVIGITLTLSCFHF